MKIIASPTTHKNNVMFIHGFLKNWTTWNITESLKEIAVESTIQNRYNTFSIQLTEDDYKKTIDEITNEIQLQLLTMTQNTPFTCTIVAHSQGSFYAASLAILWPKVYKKLFLIDPCVKCSNYLAYLESQAINQMPDSIAIHKLNNYLLLPDFNNIKSSIIVRIHISSDLNEPEKLISKLKLLFPVVNKNTKSRLIVNSTGHMMHYKIPTVIIDSILELCDK